MKKWEIFEKKVYDFLVENITKRNGLVFEPIGGADSTTSDIMVLSEDEFLYYIEVKLSPAQSGQFVLTKNSELNRFELSKLNRNQNSFSNEITDYINKNMSDFEEEESYFDIKCDKELIYNWIVEHYKSKDCRIIATSTKDDDYLAFIHIDNFKENFDVSACLRKKRSGTSHVPTKDKDLSVESLKKHFEKLDIKIESIEYTEDRLKVFTGSEVLKKSDKYFGDVFFLSEKENYYEVKKQSKTNNLNVIFSVNYTGPKQQTKLEDLIKIIS